MTARTERGDVGQAFLIMLIAAGIACMGSYHLGEQQVRQDLARARTAAIEASLHQPEADRAALAACLDLRLPALPSAPKEKP